MKLTDWVPALADETGLPWMIIHAQAQQLAGKKGIPWAMDMPAEDVDVLRTEVRAKNIGARAAIRRAQTRKNTRKG